MHSYNYTMAKINSRLISAHGVRICSEHPSTSGNVREQERDWSTLLSGTAGTSRGNRNNGRFNFHSFCSERLREYASKAVKTDGMIPDNVLIIWTNSCFCIATSLTISGSEVSTSPESRGAPIMISPRSGASQQQAESPEEALKSCSDEPDTG